MLRSLISAAQMDRGDVERLVGAAELIAQDPTGHRRADRPVVGLVFVQESTRTRVGFEAASFRLGGQAIVVSATKFHVGMSAAETVYDTARAIEGYCDVLCLRHPDADAPRRLHDLLVIPVVNCGNGYAEHPTQALIDILAIRAAHGRVDGLRIAVVGDLRFARSVHSLVLLLALFDGVVLTAVSPPDLQLPLAYRDPFLAAGGSLRETAELELDGADVVYVAGFPPTNPAGTFSDEVRRRYRITGEIATALQPGASVLCPLPRIDEISADVDDLPVARYFRQSALGLAMRMAVLAEVLG